MNSRPKRNKTAGSYKDSEGDTSEEEYQGMSDIQFACPAHSWPVQKASSSTSKKPRKRAAPKTDANAKPKKRRAYAGMLKAVTTDLPLEVVDKVRHWTLAGIRICLAHSALQIVEFLDPNTLINLSRTSTLFRNRLLSSDTFWRSARQNAGMPELAAQDITQRQYILLVFDKHCHVR